MFRKTPGMSVLPVLAVRSAGLRSRPAGPPEMGPAEGRAAKAEPVRRRERQLAGWCLSAGLLLTCQTLAVVPLQAQNTRATGEPHVIDGEPNVGKTVTANKGTITDDDGLSKADNGDAGYAYSYQWIRVEGDEEDDISGATDSTYTLAEADEGRRVRVRVSFRDDLDNDESRTSDDFPFYGSIQAGATPAEPSADAVELVGNSRQTVAAVLESAGGAFHRRLAQMFTVRAGVDYTLEEVTVCARGDNRGLTAAIHAADGNDSGIPADGRLHGLVRTSTGTSGDVVFGPAANAVLAAGTRYFIVVDGPHVRRRPCTTPSRNEDAESLSGWSIGDSLLSRDSEYDWSAGDDRLVVTLKGVSNADGNATGKPDVSGPPAVGDTLAAAKGTIADAEGLARADDRDTAFAYGYQWLRVDGGTDTEITVATDSTYVLADADEGKSIRVEVGFRDDAGTLESVTSDTTGPIRPRNTKATGEPHAIDGEPYAGKTVTANKGDIADAEGLTKAAAGDDGYAYSYQWIRVEGDDEDDIAGATDSTYTLAEADEGRRVRVRVSFRDDLDNDESRTSDDFPFYGSIQAGATPAAPSADAVELVGNSRQTVAAVGESAGGPFHRRLAQRFTVRAGVDYTLEEVTVCARGDNRGLTVAIHAVDGNDSGIPADGRLHGLVRTSTGTSGDVVFGPAANAVLAAGTRYFIVVDGPHVRRRPCTTPSRSEDDESLSGWSIGDSLLSRDSGSEWSAGDDRLVVTLKGVSNADGNSTGNPDITGKPTVGDTLAAAKGTIADAEGLTKADNGDTAFAYGYQWVRVDGGTDTEIPGATDSIHVLADADEGKSIRVEVGFRDDAGTLESITGDTTGPIRPRNTKATGEPHAIDGEPYAGKTVTANKGDIADAEGLTKADDGAPGYAYGYQWIRVDGTEEEDISGATDSTYTLTEADEGRRVRVRVSFRDDLDNDESRTSDDFPFYGSIQAGATPATPSADAVELVGNSRQTVAAVLESAGGAFHRRLAQRFTVRAGVDYTLEEVTVCARGDNRGLTAAIHAADGNDSGIPADGRLHGLVRTSTGTSGDVVFGPAANAVLAAGTRHFIVVDGPHVRRRPCTTPSRSEDDESLSGWSIGDSLLSRDSEHDEWSAGDDRLVVTLRGVSNADGNSTGNPDITGPPAVGDTLTAAKGTIDDTEGLAKADDRDAGFAYAYRWLRVEGGTEIEIPGATDSIYVLGDADEGKSIRVEMGFRDDAGTREYGARDSKATIRPRNNAATGHPHVIDGERYVGKTLTANTGNIADDDGLTKANNGDADYAYGYQWIRGNQDITNATASTYTLTTDDEGQTVKVRVSFRDDADNDESRTSRVFPNHGTIRAAVTPTTLADDAVTLVSNLDGVTGFTSSLGGGGGSDGWRLALKFTVRAGTEYTLQEVRVKILNNNRGVSAAIHAGSSSNPGAYRYGLVRTSTETSGRVVFAPPANAILAGGTSYFIVLDGPHAGRQPRVTETNGEDAASLSGWTIANSRLEQAVGFAWSAGASSTRVPIIGLFGVSNATGNATGAPAITGNAAVGDTLTAAKGTIADAEGLTKADNGDADFAYGYQWVRVDGGTDTEITDATDSTYVLVDADSGKSIKVEVSFRDDAGTLESVTSDTTATIRAPNNPATGHPYVIDGEPYVDKTLTASKGNIRDDDGRSNANNGVAGYAYTYQWIRVDGTDENDIAGATGETYTLTADDEGKSVKVRANFRDNADNDEARTSLAFPNYGTIGPAVTPTTLSDDALTLVSNLTASPEFEAELGGVNDLFQRALKFTVRAGTDYTLQAVRVLISGNNRGVSAAIHAEDPGDSDNPADDRLYPLVRTSAATSDSVTFVPPANAVLAGGTSYFIVLDGPHATRRAWFMATDSEDDVSLSGWTIADDSRSKHNRAAWAGSDRVTQIGLFGVSNATGNATGAPTIAGTPAVGNTLAATSQTIADAEGLTKADNGDDGFAYGYQWVRVDGGTETEITGATESTYLLVDDDAAKSIKVTMSFRDDAGTPESLTSDTTGTIRAPNNPATGQPAISGVAQAGKTLTAATDDIEDDDGLEDATFSYQWIRVDDSDNESDITGATSSTYTLATADVGNRIRVAVSFTDDVGYAEGPLESNLHPSTPPGARVVAEKGPCPADNDWCGTLTLWYDRSLVSPDFDIQEFGFDPDLARGDLDPYMFTHGSKDYTVDRILRALIMRQGTITTHEFDIKMVGDTLPDGTVLNVDGTTFTVTPESRLGTLIAERWDLKDLGISFDWVEGQELTVSLNLPPVLETARVDTTSLVLTYAETLDDTSVPAADAYSVKVDDGAGTEPAGVAIDGAAVTLTLGTAVEGRQTVTVSYSVPSSNPVQDESGIEAHALADQAVTNVSNAEATGKPAVSGVAQAGKTLAAETDDIEDDDGLENATFSYQWIRVDDSDNETDIAGATSDTYTLATADVGNRIRVAVSFTDDEGAAEGPLESNLHPSAPPGARVVAEKGPCPADNDWCGTLTMWYYGYTILSFFNQEFGFVAGDGLGDLDPDMFTHEATDYTVELIQRWLAMQADTIHSHDLAIQTSGATLPDGTVLNVGGTTFTISPETEHPLIDGADGWNLKDLDISFDWVEGQELTVSLNLPPVLETARVDTTSLVLTYIETLDDTSVPAVDAYSVKVDDGAGTEPAGVAIDGAAVSLTLGTAVENGQTVTVSYAVPASNPVQDEGGAVAHALADRAVTNVTKPDTTTVIVQTTQGAVTEGDTVRFLVRTLGPALYEVVVSMAYSQEGSFWVRSPPPTVTFAVGDTLVEVEVRTVDDNTQEDNGGITAEVRPGNGYVVGSHDSVFTEVQDNDASGGICRRTPKVRDRILTLLRHRHRYKGDCSGVTDTTLAELRSLDVDEVGIASLREGDFAGLSGVTYLGLMKNRLTTLPADIFAGMDALEELRLGGNRLESPLDGVFVELPALEKLAIYDNEIDDFPFDDLETLESLTRIYHGGNPGARYKVQVKPLQLAVGSDSVQYKVRLLSPPGSTEPVEIGANSPSGLSVTPASRTFTKSDWWVRQTFTVKAPGEVDGTVYITHKVLAGYFKDKAIDSVAVTKVAEMRRPTEAEDLALVAGLSPRTATAALLGEGELTQAQLAALDRLGNANGGYDLGDVLSWIDRCRRGEAECGTSHSSVPAGLPTARKGGGTSRRTRGDPRSRTVGRARVPPSTLRLFSTTNPASSLH